MGVLAKILEAKHREIAALAGRSWPAPPPRRAISLGRPAGAPLGLIAEIKRRSPSAGPLSTVLTVTERAQLYARGGASMISVLTDAPFFDGAFEHLSEARAACELPILCKDFVLDEVQLDAARAHGADAILIIARCLAPERTLELVAGARARELEPVLEIAADAEVELARRSGASIIGVNARDLDTLEIDPERTTRIMAGLPKPLVRVHLSGLRRPEDVARVAARDVDAALVGEALMRQDDPSALLAAMRARCSPNRER